MSSLVVAALLAGLPGCAGVSGVASANVLLESPLRDQCEQAKLAGCEDLSAGTLLYLDGKKSEGALRIQRAAATNSPEELKRFAEAVRALSALPGASSLAEPLGEVASLIAGEKREVASAAEVEAPKGSAALPRERAETPPTKVITADTDPAQRRRGVVTVPTRTPSWCSAVFGTKATCRKLTGGPFFLTSAASTTSVCLGQSLAVLWEGDGSIQFQIDATLGGRRLFIGPSDMLVLVQQEVPLPENAPSAKRPATPEALGDEIDPRLTCGLYWEGFVPYGEVERWQVPQVDP